MALTRDSKWLDIYNSGDASKYSNADRIKFTTAIWKASNKSNEIKKKKKEKSLKIIDFVEIETTRQAETKVFTKHVCQSHTMAGKPCSFKAVSMCGRYCKKHSL